MISIPNTCHMVLNTWPAIVLFSVLFNRYRCWQCTLHSKRMPIVLSRSRSHSIVRCLGVSEERARKPWNISSNEMSDQKTQLNACDEPNSVIPESWTLSNTCTACAARPRLIRSLLDDVNNKILHLRILSSLAIPVLIGGQSVLIERNREINSIHCTAVRPLYVRTDRYECALKLIVCWRLCSIQTNRLKDSDKKVKKK